MKELNENIVRVLENNGFYVGKPDYSNHHKEYCVENQSVYRPWRRLVDELVV